MQYLDGFLSRFFATDVDPTVVLPSSHDPLYVVLSFFVAALAGFCFIKLLHRISEQEKTLGRYLWMAGGALIMGLGIWAMHFLGMLAYRLPVPVEYDPVITAFSAVPAVLASGWNLHIVGHARVSRTRLFLGGIVFGSGIGLMHYSGMGAIDFDAYIRYDPLLFVLSLLIAVLMAIFALWVAVMGARRSAAATLMSEVISAQLIGLAVAGMHYTAMSSTICFARTGSSTNLDNTDPTLLAGAVVIVATLILLAGIAAVFLDRRLESEVQRREVANRRADHTGERLQMIMDNVGDAVITLDIKGNIESCNRATTQIFGYEEKEIVGLNFSYLISNLKSNRGQGSILKFISDPTAGKLQGNEFEVLGRQKGGTYVHLEAVLTHATQDDRPLTIAALRDITERNVAAAALARAKETAEKASQAKTDFISHMSHELRTPLNAVIGISDMLLEVKSLRDNSESLTQYLTDIRASGRHLLSLVNDILDVSMIESGNRPFKPETFEAIAEIEGIVRPFDTVLLGSEQSISIAHPGGSVMLTADRQSFRQTLLNLIANAISHGGEHVDVEVRIEESDQDGFVGIVVYDNGSGVPEGIIEAVGQPFLYPNNAYTYEASRSSERNSGLGLFIVNRLMALNGGKFHLESTPGRGTSAKTIWPISQQAA